MNTSHTIRVNPAHTLAILAKGLVDAGILSEIQAKTARITVYRARDHIGKPCIGLTVQVMEMGNENPYKGATLYGSYEDVQTDKEPAHRLAHEKQKTL